MKTSQQLFTLLSTVIWLAAVACEPHRAEPAPATSSAAPPPVASPPPIPTVSAQTPTVEAKMAEHFTSSVAMRNALIRGDLDAFRAAAATLSDKEFSANLSDTWKPYLEDMRTAAKSARDAKNVDVGARTYADMGRACAACHTKLGGPKLTVGAAPAQGSGAQPHMARHDWAAARLWDGLMAPSDEAWTKGAEVFADAPLEPEVVAGPKSVPPDVAELAKRAHVFGQQAHTAKDATARAKAVADVYGTCVGCHSKLSVTIK